MKKITILTTLLTFILVTNFFVVFANAESEPIINIVYPKPGSTITELRPEIKVEYSDSEGINVNSVRMQFEFYDVTDFDEITEITSDYITYAIPEIFQLERGKSYNVTITVADTQGNSITQRWGFNVSQEPPAYKEGFNIDVLAISMYLLIGTAIGGVAIGIYILYLKKTKDFTFRKFFAQHPLQKQYLIIYLPLTIAFIFTLLGFAYVMSNDGLPDFAPEYVFVAGFFIALLPFAIDSQLEKRRIFRNERGFAQFLFEMADAMRGGLDPSKAVVELAKTNSGILREKLKIASDSIRIGRPFEDVITSMGKSFKSDLIRRYSSIIGEASKIGGETSTVIFRAAKDMDDFIKVKIDRKRELTVQATTAYISFVVLIVIIYILLGMFPSFEGIDISLLEGSGGLESAAAAASEGSDFARIPMLTLTRRFFHVVLANAIGTGAVIGGFLDGKVKYGLLHILLLVLLSTIFFAVTVF